MSNRDIVKRAQKSLQAMKHVWSGVTGDPRIPTIQDIEQAIELLIDQMVDEDDGDVIGQTGGLLVQRYVTENEVHNDIYVYFGTYERN